MPAAWLGRKVWGVGRAVPKGAPDPTRWQPKVTTIRVRYGRPWGTASGHLITHSTAPIGTFRWSGPGLLGLSPVLCRSWCLGVTWRSCERDGRPNWQLCCRLFLNTRAGNEVRDPPSICPRWRRAVRDQTECARGREMASGSRSYYQERVVRCEAFPAMSIGRLPHRGRARYLRPAEQNLRPGRRMAWV